MSPRWDEGLSLLMRVVGSVCGKMRLRFVNQRWVVALERGVKLAAIEILGFAERNVVEKSKLLMYIKENSEIIILFLYSVVLYGKKYILCYFNN